MQSSFLPVKAICFGLGSLSFRRPLSQLALAIETFHMFRISRNRFAYDPVFQIQDIELLKSLDIDVIPPDKAYDYTVRETTLFYMPFCDAVLYEAVLRANWSAEMLGNVGILGNNLSSYVERNSKKKMKREFPCIFAISDYLDCRPLPQNFEADDTFSDLCFTTFSISRMPDINNEFWECIGFDTLLAELKNLSIRHETTKG
ncbi:SRR1-like protein [Neolecta irregularis DAH-3]|uniref:SRR1-like protein n=1 Tax=Neolecta irregularis (strain DAH-3) TaxID=1198029 RepID=A0A1U7LR17_NEOID|nr:SRR1-like protein [Neolecta irregularis DAH-3]|eukprot:OLL25023.1 SRR1-like protein [Neolecta irregularis DAH-3]